MANDINAAVDAVEVALARITTGNGYNFTLANSDFIGAESSDTIAGDRPRAYIVSVEDEVKRFSPSRLFRMLTVAIRGVVPGQNYRGLQADALKLWADIEKAMYYDRTLGAAVSTLEYRNGTISFSREAQTANVDMTFVLHIHYAEGTP